MCNGDVTGDSSDQGSKEYFDIGRDEFVLDLSEVVKICEGRECDQKGDNQHW